MPHREARTAFGLGREGFTLIELVIIITILGILATVAVPRFVNIADNSKTAATRQEMQHLRQALSGNPSVTAGGSLVDRGFEGDVGFLPSQLADLALRPDSVPTYNPITGLGWNGPYIEASGNQYLTDAWGVPYEYLPTSRLLISVGGPDTLTSTL